MSAPREPLPLPWWLRGSFWRWVVRVAAALVLLALTLATWVLLYPPSLGPVRQDLQELVSRKLHRKVSFDTLTWTWSNGLKVRVTGVELGSKALRVQKVRLGVKLLPLLRGEVRFQGLELVGLDLPLERRADGRLFAGGFYMDPDRNLIFPLLARFGHFRITHSTLRWRDRVPGHPVRVALRDWRVDVHRQGTAHRVEVHGSLGNGEVEARGRIRDFGQGPSGWRLDVRMAAAGLAPDTIRPYLGDRGPDRLLGRLAFRADVQGGLGAGVEVTGRAALRGGGVRWPARLRAPLEGLEARGRFRYRLDAKGQDLELRALKLQRGPLTVTGQGGLRLAKGDGGPRVDLDLRSGSVELEDLDPFYRLRALPPKLRSWLQEALAGRIVRTHMVLHGPLARFPFPDNQGRFRVEAEVQDVRLDYHHGWPPLEGLAGTLVLDGRRLAFSNGSARILRARVSGLGASVHDFAARPPRLRLHGTVDLNLLDGARFLERSGLVEPGFLDPGVLVGGGRLELGLELPLGGEEAPEVYGTLHLQRAAY
ncbi:MAG TPA: DUF3971 domain-containing protein, partial [Gammaproteobacteria bacterium]|nr:DUF3971 domain-containing protein [Gammaproteobacteria bacterium]